ncbi:HNH endonuclease family protein [Enhygromyxa salina]|uniref:GmrSD restriction endonucleases C-terminal domain-containing protein n=1 Tax=Enhygromyxa salina TaxID=215803 RepID=A0A2S9YDW9_9BACT|nr:HNH endonuclease family protein [Enhygromyxa salina]PRQ03206.1 hypothetical protein ENSA7_53460 [Enhygromyxa salina]
MRIDQSEHEMTYRQHWQPIERLLSNTDMTEFFRQYLMKDGGTVKVDAVYVELKHNTDKRAHATPIAQLQEIHRYAEYYRRIVEPANEPDPALQRSLSNLRRLNFGVAASFLLNLYEDYSTGRILASVLADTLAVVENFLIRRFVCGIPTNVLNKLFPTLYRQARLDEAFSLDRLKSILSDRGYPSDEDFRARLSEIRLYGGGDRREKSRFILDRLEDSFEHKEKVVATPLQVEHVMPQTLSASWREALGDDVDDDHDSFLHRIGNLTLTGYNQEMSNAPYAVKRKHLIGSHIELNRHFQGVETWDFEAIKRRSEALATRALSVWPNFHPQTAKSKQAPERVTGTKPTAIRIGKESHDVKMWSEVLEKVIRYLNESYPDRFITLKESFPKYISLDPSSLRVPRSAGNSYFYEANLSAQSIYRVCEYILQLADCGDDWNIDTRDA